MSSTHKKDIRDAQIQLLKNLREDIREMEWDKLDDDDCSILVRKSDVLQIVNDWIEYVLEPVDA